jgi:hypothetical protein
MEVRLAKRRRAAQSAFDSEIARLVGMKQALASVDGTQHTALTLCRIRNLKYSKAQDGHIDSAV